MLRLLERERERVEALLRAEPDEAAPARVDFRPEDLRVARADAAVDAVAADHEVGAVVRRHGALVAHSGLEDELHAKLLATRLQDVEQPLAADAAEAVAAGRDLVPLEEHVDVVPVIERLEDRPRRRLVGRDEIAERLVGEHDAPAERVVGAIALDDDDLVPRVLLLHQQAEVEAGRPAADAHDVHSSPSRIYLTSKAFRCQPRALDERWRCAPARGPCTIGSAKPCRSRSGNASRHPGKDSGARLLASDLPPDCWRRTCRRVRHDRERIASMKTWKMAWPALAMLASALLIPAAQAQTNVRVRGTITAVTSDSLSVKSRDGRDLKLELPADVAVAVAKAARFEDIKPGDYLGATTNPGPDGTLVAVELHYLAPTVPEGHIPWDLVPGSMMTNAKVGAVQATGKREVAAAVQGRRATDRRSRRCADRARRARHARRPRRRRVCVHRGAGRARRHAARAADPGQQGRRQAAAMTSSPSARAQQTEGGRRGLLEFDHWHPGIASRIPREIRHLATIYRPENVCDRRATGPKSSPI